jgi:putative methyltransferase
MQRKRIRYFVLSSMPWVPYSYGALRAYCDGYDSLAANYEWEEPEFIARPALSFLDKDEAPDVLCFSMYMWNEKLQNAIAGFMRSKYPDALIVFGGPSVPNSASCVNRGYQADLLVHGEGEMPFAEILLRYLAGGSDFSSIPNVTVLNPRYGTVGFRGFEKRPIDHLPSPYLMGLFENALNQKTYNGIKIIALWERERGCPYRCSFCDWPWTGTRVRSRPLDQMLQEISYIASKKIDDVYMCDANFGISETDLDIALELARVKKETGFPKALIYSSAKRSDDRVQKISRILADADMVWGTSLSVQSTHAPTLKAIKRVNMPPQRFQSFATDFSTNRVGVYSEVILGLPEETKTTFTHGIGEIFEAGNHEDLRMFEFFFLPNAPMNTPEEIEKYGLVVRSKPLNMLSERSHSPESVDIVVGTKDMPFEDWVYCYTFGEIAQALHNGGYTRYLSIYLNRERGISYRDFYVHLTDAFLASPESKTGRTFNRLYSLLRDFGARDDIPTVHKMIWFDDIREDLRKYGPKRKGWIPYQYVWLMLSEDFETVFAEIDSHLRRRYGVSGEKWEDILNFQKAIMLRPDYSPETGKTHQVSFNWFDFFYKGAELQRQSAVYRFTDRATGPGHRFPLDRNGLDQFARSAVGEAYPFSKLRQFCHQPECIEVYPSSSASHSLSLTVSSGQPTFGS